MLRPQTPRLKRVVELSISSRSSGNSVTLPQSLLLGILLEGNGVAVRALTSMSLNLARLRAEIEAPNHVPDPTSPSVTPPAGAGGAPSVAADH